VDTTAECVGLLLSQQSSANIHLGLYERSYVPLEAHYRSYLTECATFSFGQASRTWAETGYDIAAVLTERSEYRYFGDLPSQRLFSVG